MIKLTSTKSGMRIVTVKAMGAYVNVSFGRARPAKRASARRAFDIDIAFGASSCAVLFLSACLHAFL